MAGEAPNATKIWELGSSKAGQALSRPDVFGAIVVAMTMTLFAKLSGSVGGSSCRLRSLRAEWLGGDGLRTASPTEPDSSAKLARVFASRCAPNTSGLQPRLAVSRWVRFCRILVAFGKTT